MAAPLTDHTNPRRVVPTEQARQGETSGHVRWVLRVSLTLAILAGAVLWFIYAH